jgi:outer membrane protein assembly factor BamB
MVNKAAIFIGIHNSVLALDSATGKELWRTSLKSSHFALNVALIDGQLYASSRGEVWALDPETGDVRWHNKLKGLGMGLVTFAGPLGDGNAASVLAAAQQHHAAAGGAAAAAAAAS